MYMALIVFFKKKTPQILRNLITSSQQYGVIGQQIK